MLVDRTPNGEVPKHATCSFEPRTVRACNQCGEQFPAPHRLTKYCGFDCSKKAQREQQRQFYRKNAKKPKAKKCRICLRIYQPRNSQSVTCSKKCSVLNAKAVQKSRQRYHTQALIDVGKAMKLLNKKLIEINDGRDTRSYAEIKAAYDRAWNKLILAVDSAIAVAAKGGK